VVQLNDEPPPYRGPKIARLMGGMNLLLGVPSREVYHRVEPPSGSKNYWASVPTLRGAVEVWDRGIRCARFEGGTVKCTGDNTYFSLGKVAGCAVQRDVSTSDYERTVTLIRRNCNAPVSIGWARGATALWRPNLALCFVIRGDLVCAGMLATMVAEYCPFLSVGDPDLTEPICPPTHLARGTKFADATPGIDSLVRTAEGRWGTVQANRFVPGEGETVGLLDRLRAIDFDVEVTAVGEGWCRSPEGVDVDTSSRCLPNSFTQNGVCGRSKDGRVMCLGGPFGSGAPIEVVLPSPVRQLRLGYALTSDGAVYALMGTRETPSGPVPLETDGIP